jgi:hypothetical protein
MLLKTTLLEPEGSADAGLAYLVPKPDEKA